MEDFNKKKNQMKISCLTRWLRLNQSGIHIEDLLRQSGYNRIAIYGFCEIAMCLVYELQNTTTEVVCILDRKGEEIPFAYPCYHPNEVGKMDIDAVIVTPVDDIKEIKKVLIPLVKKGVDIVSIEDVLYEL